MITKGNTKELFKNVGITLDGYKNFIVVYNHKGSNTYPIKYKKNSNDPIRFTSMELAMCAAHLVFNDNRSKITYKLYVGSNEYDIKEAMNINGYYQLYDNEKQIKYYIKEKEDINVRWIGYISLDNGFYERKDKNYGIQRSKQLFSSIERAAQRLIVKNETNSISRVDKISDREYIFYVKNSTAKIHIMSNSAIMDLNQGRKERGLRVIPFEKNVDKFLTSYVYITADNNEMKFFNSAEKSLDVLHNLINDIFENEEDMETLELVNVEFTGYIKDI